MTEYGVGVKLAGLAVIAIYQAACWWTIFVKAGQPGWAAIIPIYNLIVVLRISGKPGWWLFLGLIPGYNLVFAIIVVHSLSKSFGRGAGFTVAFILLNILLLPFLAIGRARYVGPGGEVPEVAPATEG